MLVWIIPNLCKQILSQVWLWLHLCLVHHLDTLRDEAGGVAGRAVDHAQLFFLRGTLFWRFILLLILCLINWKEVSIVIRHGDVLRPLRSG